MLQCAMDTLPMCRSMCVPCELDTPLCTAEGQCHLIDMPITALQYFSPGERRKRGQREYDLSEPSSGADQLRKKPRKSPPPPPQQQQFEAFDYSKTTFVNMAGPPHKASRSPFDPNQMEVNAQSSKQQMKVSFF